MPTDLADYLQLRVFGSAVSSPKDASDIDLLIIYERSRLQPDKVYRKMAGLFSSLQKIAGRPVHPVILTREEAESERFLEVYACVPLEGWAAIHLGLPAKALLEEACAEIVCS